MDTVTFYLSMVPNVFWAAIAASALTLTGVFFTNRHFSRQQKAQLEYEKEENDAGRKFELRHSVYLDAADELNQAYQHLIGLASIDIAKNNPADGLSGFFAAGTKACLVASDNTAKAIHELMEAYARVFFSLLFKTPPIQRARVERNIQNNAYEKHWAEVERISASKAQYLENAMTNSDIWNALEESHKYNLDQAEIAAEARDKAWDKLNSLKLEFTRQAISDLKHIGKLSVPALVAIRSELNIPSDIDAYYADFEGRYKRMEELLDDALTELTDD